MGTHLQDNLRRSETRYNTAGVGMQFTRSPMIMVENILNIRAPVISAVRGRVHGMAATIALFGDVVIAGDDAEFLDDHVVQGNVAGDGGACMWPLLIGPARVKWHLMTGDAISAGEAERIGLVNKVVPAAELMPTALAAEVRRVIALPEVTARMMSVGTEPRGNTPEEFAAWIRSEMVKWADIARTANIRVD